MHFTGKFGQKSRFFHGCVPTTYHYQFFIPEKKPEFKYEEINFPSLGGKPKTPVNKVCLDWRSAAIKGASKPDPIQNLKTDKESTVVKHNFTEIDLDNFQTGYDSYDDFNSDDGFPSKGGFID